jgi:hypothetical protein
LETRRRGDRALLPQNRDAFASSHPAARSARHVVECERGAPSEDVGGFLKAEMTRWEAIIKDAGTKAAAGWLLKCQQC